MATVAEQLRVLAETSQVFAEATNDTARLLRTVAERCSQVIGDGCYIRLVAADGRQLISVATYHPDPEVELYLRETVHLIPLRVGEGISGKVVATGVAVLQPVVDSQGFREATTPAIAAAYERLGVSSLVVVCLDARGSRLGFVALARNGQGRPAYTENDLHLLQDLANRAAMAIDNARLRDDLDARVRARTAELEAANQELEEFSYSVSHDLRAPLRAIDGFSRVLEEDHAAALDDSAKQTIDVIRKNVHRMGALIDDLLRFAHIGRHTVQKDAFSMADLVRSAATTTTEGVSGREIDLQIGDLPDAAADRNLLRQVWLNLLDNALKYTRPRAKAIIRVEGRTEAHEVQYTVTDNGVGFDAKYKEKLFGVFQRLHGQNEFPGTGVGLAIVQRIVARHGGRVWAESTLDQGASFGFALPKEPS